MSIWPYPFWIAHRGAGNFAPENTLAAFRLGASCGYRAFECDVKLSRDGVPFLLHDADLQRTTNGSGIAGEMDWYELSTLDAGSWHSPTFEGEPLPRLVDVAAFCSSGGHALNIEIKPTPGQEERTGRLVAETAAQLWQGSTKPLLSSFQDEALAAAQATAPQLPRALLLDRLTQGWLGRAQQLGCVAVVGHYPLFSADMMAQLRHAGLHALAYTVNDVGAALRLRALGLDGLITDAVKNHDFCA